MTGPLVLLMKGIFSSSYVKDFIPLEENRIYLHSFEIVLELQMYRF